MSCRVNDGGILVPYVQLTSNPSLTSMPPVLYLNNLVAGEMYTVRLLRGLPMDGTCPLRQLLSPEDVPRAGYGGIIAFLMIRVLIIALWMWRRRVLSVTVEAMKVRYPAFSRYIPYPLDLCPRI